MAHSRKGNRNRGGLNINPDPPVQLYLDSEKEKINPQVLDEVAEQKADKMPEGRDKITSSQLRRFFGEIKGLYNRLENGEDFSRILPLVKIMKSKVYYASDRTKIKKPFAGFILGGIDQIKDEKDFRAVVMHFEAVVGFMYGKGKVGN